MTGPLDVEMNMTHPRLQEARRRYAKVWCHYGSGAPSLCMDAVLCGKGSTRGLGARDRVPNSTHGMNWSELVQLTVIDVISDQHTLSQAGKERRPEGDLGFGHS